MTVWGSMGVVINEDTFKFPPSCPRNNLDIEQHAIGLLFAHSQDYDDSLPRKRDGSTQSKRLCLLCRRLYSSELSMADSAQCLPVDSRTSTSTKTMNWMEYRGSSTVKHLVSRPPRPNPLAEKTLRNYTTNKNLRI